MLVLKNFLNLGKQIGLYSKNKTGLIMKKIATVILCGGLGTRLSEETELRPKPMVAIGGRPILWHIMQHYSKYKFTNFTLALGYKGEYIKDYFINYHARQSNLSVNLKTGVIDYTNLNSEDWQVSLIETGGDTLTGGRLLRLKDHLKEEGTFMLTYGDGLSNVNIDELLSFHKKHGKICTVTAVKPSARFGGMEICEEAVTAFKEKPQSGEGSINGGFFVFNREIFDYLDDDQTILERSPMEKLVSDGQLMAFQHMGFWQCMDTIRDRDILQKLWDEGSAPWI
jgi:glucose-1-phosphate cytidylyltransferase